MFELLFVLVLIVCAVMLTVGLFKLIFVLLLLPVKIVGSVPSSQPSLPVASPLRKSSLRLRRLRRRVTPGSTRKWSQQCNSSVR